MPKPVCDDQQFIATWNELRSASKVAARLGVNVRAVLRRRANIQERHGVKLVSEQGASAAPLPAVDDVAALRDQLRELRTRLSAAEKESLDDQYVKRKIMKLVDQPVTPPTWLSPMKQSKGGQHVPTLMLSDLHWGERVYARQVNGVNEYDIAIAQRRLRTAIERTVDLLQHHMVAPNYPGFVLALGGDCLSGDIHEELSETNEMPVMEAMLDLAGCLMWAIRRLADEFGRVFVPCVTGNHGRNTKKPRAKNRNYTNFDWLLYNILQMQFQGDKRVQFHIPDGSDAQWAVFGHRYCLTHGDQFRSFGDSMIGALGPIARGDHKKRSRNGQVDLGYDTLLLGHFHQLIMLQRFIVNGSLKGYDEYAASGNFGFEQPQQALWLTHSERGITFSMPVQVEDRRKPTERDWVKFAA